MASSSRPRRVYSLDGIPVTIEDGNFGLLPDSTICMGYANTCICKGCKERERGPQMAQPAPRQPWELAA